LDAGVDGRGDRASLEDTAALTKALEGATSLFAMTTPFEGDTHAETRQGISAADVAKAAGVHLDVGWTVF
jgi:uncharacterized protein YbjT (DUF2867 family)